MISLEETIKLLRGVEKRPKHADIAFLALVLRTMLETRIDLTPPATIGTGQVAHILGCATGTVRKRVHAGEIVPAFRTASGLMRFDERYIQRLKEERG